MLEVLLLAVIVIAGTGGELCVSRAMKSIGEVTRFSPYEITRTVLRALKVGWMWLGVSLMALAFFSLLAMLSIENVSFVVPVTALSYAAGAVGGVLFLGESVTPRRWFGVLLVCVGVTLIWIAKH